MVDFPTFAARQRGTRLEYFRILPGIGQPYLSALVRVQIHLHVIAPPSGFSHVIGLTTRVVQPATDFPGSLLLPIGDSTIHPVRRRELDPGFPTLVDRRCKVRIPRRNLVGSSPRPYLKGTPPVRIETGDIPRRIDNADFRLLDQPVIVDVVIRASHFVSEVALNLVDPVSRYDLQRFERFDFGLDISAIGVELKLLVASGRQACTVSGAITLTLVLLLLYVRTPLKGEIV